LEKLALGQERRVPVSNESLIDSLDESDENGQNPESIT
jgi:hypothetical protein